MYIREKEEDNTGKEDEEYGKERMGIRAERKGNTASMIILSVSFLAFIRILLYFCTYVISLSA